MGVLDTITQMKNEGKSEAEIIQTLRQQKIPPKNIQEALAQAQIKSAVAGTNQPTDEDMQQSIMNDPPTPQEYVPEPQEPTAPYVPEQPMQNLPQEPMQQYPQEPAQQYNTYQEQEYAPQDYPQDQYAYQDYAQPTQDTSTLIDISEQVVNDKIKKLKQTLELLEEFKTLTETKVKTMEQRLKRIEATIDTLQASVLDKIGSYGSNLSSIKKEMSMMQDSFGKVINPLLDKKRKHL